jgi:hypothetical protein
MSKKPKPKRRKKATSAKPPAPIAIAVRGKPPWRAWAKRLAIAAKMPSLNDAAAEGMRLLAAKVGFTEAEPVRVDPRLKTD